VRRIGPAAVAALVVAGTAVVAPSATAAAPQTVNFAYTGGEQQWVVPAGVTSVRIAATGARGGTGSPSFAGGTGARAVASVPVTPGQVLYVEVGGQGVNGVRGSNAVVAGGFNGGGSAPQSSNYFGGGGGGGASDVRLVPRLQGGASLPSRLVVAAGGGGGGGGDDGGTGGAGNLDGTGAGATGKDGSSAGSAGRGATQTAGGAAGAFGTAAAAPTAGQLGEGGRSGTSAGSSSTGGGGGGGLYGGGGGNAGGLSGGGGGGGSSGFVVGATDLAIGPALTEAAVTITWTPADASPASPAAPETTIGKAPGAKVRAVRKKTKVKVTFSSPSPGATYECSLDAKAFAPCTSPAKPKVGRGRHTFAVRAVLAGVVDPTPATVAFEVKRKRRR